VVPPPRGAAVITGAHRLRLVESERLASENSRKLLFTLAAVRRFLQRYPFYPLLVKTNAKPARSDASSCMIVRRF